MNWSLNLKNSNKLDIWHAVLCPAFGDGFSLSCAGFCLSFFASAIPLFVLLCFAAVPFPWKPPFLCFVTFPFWIFLMTFMRFVLRLRFNKLLGSTGLTLEPLEVAGFDALAADVACSCLPGLRTPLFGFDMSWLLVLFPLPFPFLVLFSSRFLAFKANCWVRVNTLGGNPQPETKQEWKNAK